MELDLVDGPKLPDGSALRTVLQEVKEGLAVHATISSPFAPIGVERDE